MKTSFKKQNKKNYCSRPYKMNHETSSKAKFVIITKLK